MKDSSLIRKLNRHALLIAMVHFVISFFTDRLIFQYLLWDFSDIKNALRSVEAWIVKLAFGLFLILLWQGIFYFCKKADRTFRRIACLYGFLMLCLLLLTWPGIWRQDEFGLLSSAIQLFPLFWQNYLSSVFYILALMLIPIPSGVILIQCICIALIVARIETLLLCVFEKKLAKKGKNLKKSGKIAYFCIFSIAFLLFPVLDSNLYPIRMSLYAFLELLLVVELIGKVQKSELQKNAKDTLQSFLVLVLAAIVTVWRSEAIYYVVFFPVVWWIIGSFAKEPAKRIGKQILIYLTAFLVFIMPQKVGDFLTDGQQYELTSIVLPLVPLVQKAAEENQTDFLDAVDPIMKVDVILSEAKQGKTGIQIFWSHPEYQQKHSEEEFRAFRSAYHSMIIKYPSIFIKERFQTFLDTTDLLDNTTLLFTKDGVAYYETFRQYPFVAPLNDNVRTSVIKTLEIKNRDDYEIKLKITDVIYSAVPALMLLLFTCIVLCVRKRWALLSILLLPLIKVPLIFLTAPSRLFMYYYSIYLIGYALLFFVLARWVIYKTGIMRAEEKK